MGRITYRGYEFELVLENPCAVDGVGGVVNVDLGLQIGFIAGEDGGIFVIKRSQVRIGIWGYGNPGAVNA